MREGFDNAGFPRREATGTVEAGFIREVPTKHGKVDVRTMEGGKGKGHRAVTTRPGTDDPTRLSGERFRRNESQQQRRAGGHTDQTP